MQYCTIGIPDKYQTVQAHYYPILILGHNAYQTRPHTRTYTILDIKYKGLHPYQTYDILSLYLYQTNLTLPHTVLTHLIHDGSLTRTQTIQTTTTTTGHYVYFPNPILVTPNTQPTERPKIKVFSVNGIFMSWHFLALQQPYIRFWANLAHFKSRGGILAALAAYWSGGKILDAEVAYVWAMAVYRSADSYFGLLN